MPFIVWWFISFSGGIKLLNKLTLLAAWLVLHLCPINKMCDYRPWLTMLMFTVTNHHEVDSACRDLPLQDLGVAPGEGDQENPPALGTRHWEPPCCSWSGRGWWRWCRKWRSYSQRPSRDHRTLVSQVWDIHKLMEYFHCLLDLATRQ